MTVKILAVLQKGKLTYTYRSTDLRMFPGIQPDTYKNMRYRRTGCQSLQNQYVYCRKQETILSQKLISFW